MTFVPNFKRLFRLELAALPSEPGIPTLQYVPCRIDRLLFATKLGGPYIQLVWIPRHDASSIVQRWKLYRISHKSKFTLLFHLLIDPMCYLLGVGKVRR